MPSEITSRLEFFMCDTCKGFGYVMTPAKKHIQCDRCHGYPSVYALLDNQLLWWKRSISSKGILQRKIHRVFHIGFNIILLCIGVIGLASLALAGFHEVQQNNSILLLITTPQSSVGWFWASVLVDLFLYYRLERESASKKQLQYGEDTFHAIKRPANPTFQKFHEMHQHARTDISLFFAEDALQAVDHAYLLAKKLRHHQITPLHLLGGVLNSGVLAMMMARLGLDQKTLYQKIGKAMSLEGVETGRGLDLNIEAYQTLFFAYEEARKNERRSVDVMELFLAIVHTDHWATEVFYDLELDEHIIAQAVEWIYIQRHLRDRFYQWQKKASKKPKGIMDRAMTAQPSPLLESLSQDYTAQASRGGFFPLIARKSEMDQMVRILRERTGNIMLVGPSGVGKTTLFEGLAELMASEEVPPELQDKRLLVVDPGAIVANASGVGAVEGRMQQMIHEIARAGNIILAIEDVHHLLNMRSTGGSEDVAGILMNALSQGVLKMIATTTTEEYQQFIENHAPFVRRFQMVRVDEMSKEDAIRVLEAKSGSIEYKHHVYFSYASIESIVDLTSRFMQDRYLPSKALDIMAEVAGFVEARRGGGTFVGKEDVAEVIAEKTNVQVSALTEDDRDKLLHLEKLFHERMVGQEEAVLAVASALRRSREGLRDEKRPIATLLFLGPTGVGKTEMAKTIAEVYFGSEDRMIRLDMSEYQDMNSLKKLIGGTGQKGLLTEAIRLKPFSLVLLDELEKAHPDILNIFLQVMDDGRLTDGMGRTFDMSNTMVIATSNAGTQHIQNSIAAGLQMGAIKTQLLEEVLPNIFRPEFINRFDHVAIFSPLTFDEVVLIAQRLLAKLAEKLLSQKGVVMEFDPEAIVELAQLGYDPQYGARPLRRVIQDTVDDALAKLLLEKELNRRDHIVLKPGGRIEIQKAVGL